MLMNGRDDRVIGSGKGGGWPFNATAGKAGSTPQLPVLSQAVTRDQTTVLVAPKGEGVSSRRFRQYEDRPRAGSACVNIPRRGKMDDTLPGSLSSSGPLGSLK